MYTINENLKETTCPVHLLKEHFGETVQIHGSIYKIRKMRGFAFVLLRTREGIIQCVYGESAEFSLEELTEEACVIFTAKVISEERAKAGFELHLISLRVLSTPAAPSPIVINNKQVDTSLENLLSYRPITLRNEKERAIFRIQEGLCQGFRNFLIKQHFTEIHTPKIVAAGAEGGANIFSLKYFGKDAYLAQSPQFYKQCMVGVFERVFEIAPVFRAEKHDTSRHLNEYTSVDFEMGYLNDFTELMQTELGMIFSVLAHLKESYGQELSLLEVKLQEVTEIPVIGFHEAKDLIADTYGRKITDYEDSEPEEEKLLSEIMLKETGSDFVFVTHYPASKRPFYAMEAEKTVGGVPVTLSFDLLFRGLEVTTRGQRIHDYEQQLAKMQALGMHTELFESYLMAHKYGLPPHGGIGLGLERFTARLLGFENVRRAALFPRDIHRVMP